VLSLNKSRGQWDLYAPAIFCWMLLWFGFPEWQPTGRGIWPPIGRGIWPKIGRGIWPPIGRGIWPQTKHLKATVLSFSMKRFIKTTSQLGRTCHGPEQLHRWLSRHRRRHRGGGSPVTCPQIIEKRPCTYQFLSPFAPLPIFWFAHPIFLTSLRQCVTKYHDRIFLVPHIKF